MADENRALMEKLDRLESAVSSLASSALEIGDRLELLHQEFSRSAAQLQRVGLNQESFKLAGQRRDDALKQITAELSRIKAALEKTGR